MNIRTHIFTAILLATVGSVTVHAADWRPISNSDSSFDASRITRISPSILRVWVKYVLSEETLDYAKKEGVSNRYRDYSYSIALRQIDCSRQTIGFVSIHNFNFRGAPIGPSTQIKDAEIEMNPAVPDTYAEALIETICGYSNRNLQKK